jgi:tetratricopeptide (TPR) repeat protein/DNA-binding winged helix-turn-helix (wHTH) protein
MYCPPDTPSYSHADSREARGYSRGRMGWEHVLEPAASRVIRFASTTVVHCCSFWRHLSGMETSADPVRTLRFGIFELDSRAGELRKHGVRVHLQDQPFQILLLLLNRPGALVTREEIRRKLWSADTFVDFDRNLNKAINKVRLALGDSAESPRFVETLHRRGYRFIAPVQVQEEAVAALANASAAPVLPHPDRRRPQLAPVIRISPHIPERIVTLKWWYVSVLVSLVLGGLAYVQYRPHNTSAVARRRSVAVLGFKNLSGRAEQAWLSTALSDWITTELSAGGQLRTIPADSITRMKIELSLSDQDSLEHGILTRIGKDLGTDLVVVGSYASLGKDAGGQIRLDLRVQDTRTGEAIDALSETGTEARLFDLVAHAGARLRSDLGISAVTGQQAAEVQVALPVNHAATRLYSEGLAKLRVFDPLSARHLLQDAIAAEPNFALSHSALATAWSSLGYDENAKTEAKRAFELSSNLPHEDRLLIEGRYHEISKDWEKAIEIYRTLFEFFPDSLDYGLALANAQTSCGKGTDALATARSLKILPNPLGDDPRIDMVEGRAAESLGDFRRDLTATALAANKAKQVGASLLAAQASADEAWALINLGRVPDAPSIIEDAGKTFQAIGDKRGLARVANLNGIVLQSQGNALGAKQQYEVGLSIYKNIGNRKGVADELDNLGDVLFALGDLEGSRRSYEQSLAANEEIGNQDGVALAKGALGPVLLALGDHEGAKKSSLESLEICQRIGDRSKAAIALAGVGAALRVEGNIANAQKYGTQAVSLFNEIGDKRSAARFQLLLAELLMDQGDDAGATRLAQKSADEFEGERAVRDQAVAYALLGRAYLAQHNFSAAVSTLNNSISLAGKYTDRSVELFVELTAALVQSSFGRTDHVEAEKALDDFVAHAVKQGFAEYAMEGRFALANLASATHLNTRRMRLESVRKEAEQKGFGLIAQNARAVLTGQSR